MSDAACVYAWLSLVLNPDPVNSNAFVELWGAVLAHCCVLESCFPGSVPINCATMA